MKKYNLKDVEEGDLVTVLVNKSGKEIQLNGEIAWGTKYAYLFHNDEHFPSSACGIFGKPYKYNMHIGEYDLDKDICWIEKQEFEEADKIVLPIFDSNKALDGMPVRTRDGKNVNILTINGEDKRYPIVGAIGRLLITYTIAGKIENDTEDALDLFMSEE